jgi:hypothetical protein
MRKTESRNNQRRAVSGVEFGSAYPPYLQAEYDSSYQYLCTKSEFYDVVIQEANQHRVNIDKRDTEYEIWFGRYAGQKITKIKDYYYLIYIRDMFRNKEPKLISQILFRIDELESKYT